MKHLLLFSIFLVAIVSSSITFDHSEDCDDDDYGNDGGIVLGGGGGGGEHFLVL